MMRCRFTAPMAACVAGGLTGAGAFGQEQYLFIQTHGIVTPEQPVVRVDVWAAFDRAYYAFAAARFSVACEAGEGVFFDPRIPKGFSGDPGYIGPDGDIVNGVKTTQFQYPPNLLADTSDPIAVWSCSWTTTDFTPRRVGVDILATDYWVYFNWFGSAGQVPYISEAFGTIEVVPAPGTGPLMAAIACLAQRRRRRRTSIGPARGQDFGRC